MAREARVRYGLPLALSLVVAWVGMTTLAALAFWRTSDRSWEAAMPWLWLWVFTVLAPTTAALRLHRSVNDLVATMPDVPDRLVDDLSNLRWLFLMFGSMTGIAAISLMVAP